MGNNEVCNLEDIFPTKGINVIKHEPKLELFLGYLFRSFSVSLAVFFSLPSFFIYCFIAHFMFFLLHRIEAGYFLVKGIFSQNVTFPNFLSEC